MMYFEDKINSIEDCNTYKNDFMRNALDILEYALEQEKLSNVYFDEYRETKDERYWRMCCEKKTSVQRAH